MKQTINRILILKLCNEHNLIIAKTVSSDQKLHFSVWKVRVEKLKTTEDPRHGRVDTTLTWNSNKASRLLKGWKFDLDPIPIVEEKSLRFQPFDVYLIFRDRSLRTTGLAVKFHFQFSTTVSGNVSTNLESFHLSSTTSSNIIHVQDVEILPSKFPKSGPTALWNILTVKFH